MKVRDCGTNCQNGYKPLFTVDVHPAPILLNSCTGVDILAATLYSRLDSRISQKTLIDRRQAACVLVWFLGRVGAGSSNHVFLRGGQADLDRRCAEQKVGTVGVGG